jgi:hypothetical protein
MVTLSIPITTTPPSEGTSLPLATMIVVLWIVVPQQDTKFPSGQ